MGFREYFVGIWRGVLGGLRFCGGGLLDHGIRRILSGRTPAGRDNIAENQAHPSNGASSSQPGINLDQPRHQTRNEENGYILRAVFDFLWDHGVGILRILFGVSQKIDDGAQAPAPIEASSSQQSRNSDQPIRQRLSESNEQPQASNEASSSTSGRNTDHEHPRPSNAEHMPPRKHPPNFEISGGDFYQSPIGSGDVIYNNNSTKKEGKDSK
uniref:uncharacterized protein LOC120333305 n=1 Tax=Styela clava TaxID=7725 RepID=UPI0019399C7C|nr:uncharacterized protein LOC120333305 [Styela clava]